MPPPYLGVSTTERYQIASGINYASGSCGILNSTRNVREILFSTTLLSNWYFSCHSPYILIFVSKGECLSLDKQIEYFTSTVVNDLPRNFRSKARLRHYLSKSIFLLSIGSNDYILNYLKQEIIANKFGNPDEFADYLLVQLSSSIKVHFLKQTMLIINIVSFTVCENLKFL
jgi:hypothetical protein